MKFPTDWETAEVKGDQIVVKECYVSSLHSRELSITPADVAEEELRKVRPKLIEAME